MVWVNATYFDTMINYQLSQNWKFKELRKFEFYHLIIILTL